MYSTKNTNRADLPRLSPLFAFVTSAERSADSESLGDGGGTVVRVLAALALVVWMPFAFADVLALWLELLMFTYIIAYALDKR